MRNEFAKTQAQVAGFTQTFETSQLRAASAVDTYTKKLEKQKVTFRDMFREQGRLRKEAYRQQLRLQNMEVTELPGTDQYGRKMYQYRIPNEVLSSWDTFSNRVGWARENLTSASIQMQNWGKNMQWAGRQMTVGFTMPLVAAGAAAGVMAYQVDRELTRIAKVYDTQTQIIEGTTAEMAAREAEVNQLRADAWNTVTVATEQYGAAATDTLQVQAELAAQGKTGMELQRATNEVMRISTLGEFEAAEATETLTALTSILGLSAKEAGDAFNYLNAIENATSLATEDFARAIPIALGPMKEMGGDLQDLALLLVAMKERGIEAGEGANAIKSMMQRLYRPSKAIREEWQKLAGVDLVEMVRDAGGNIMEILPQIQEAVEDMSRPNRVQLLGGLFGTYQVARQNAILNGLRDINNEAGQTNRVLEVNEQGWESWQETADREIKALQESASTQFDIAWNRLKNMSAAFGLPFLEGATVVLNLLADIGNAVINMPDFAKSILKWGTVILAIVGPLGMLVGLTMNFAGMMGRAGGFVLGLMGKMNLLNRETAVTHASMKLAAGNVVSTAEAMSVLAANSVSAASSVGSVGAAAVKSTAQLEAMLLAAEAARRSNVGVHMTSQGLTPTGRGGMAAIQAEAIAENAVFDSRRGAQAERSTAAVAENTKKINSNLLGAGLASGVLVGSMIAAEKSSSEWVDNLATIAITATLLGPAFSGIASAAKGMVTNYRAAKVEAAGVAKNAGTAAAATGASVGRAAALRAAFLGIMGPVGWIAAAITAVGTGLYILHKRSEEQWKKEYEAQQTLSDSAEAYATSVGEVAKGYERIELSQSRIIDQNEMMKMIDLYETGSQKETTEAYDSLDEEDKENERIKMFIDLMKVAGLTANQAGDHIQAMMIASGESVTEASAAVQDLIKNWRKLNDDDWSNLMSKQTEGLAAGIAEYLDDSDHDEKLVDSAERLAEVFSGAFANADMGREARQVFGQFSDAAMSEWQNVYDNLQTSTKGQEFLAAEDINNVKELAHWYNETEDATAQMYGHMGPLASHINRQAEAASKVEKSVVQAAAKYIGLGDHITTLIQLQEEANIKARMMSYKDALAEIKEIQASAGAIAGTKIAVSYNMETGEGEIDEERTAEFEKQERVTRLAAINAYNLAHGFRRGRSEAEALYYFTNKVPKALVGGKVHVDGLTDAERRATAEAKRLKAAWDAIDWSGPAQEVMSNVTSDIADMASANFDAAMNSSLDSYRDSQQSRIDGLQAAHERASNGLENAQENATDAFEKRWERRTEAVEKHFDNRIKRIQRVIDAENKAEEQRKRIFEAETARIQRMNDMDNATVNFNVALDTGDLDEAARIRNDMAASQEQWDLEDEDKRAERQHERTIKRLEDQIEKVEELKDKRLEALEEIEERERKSLERMQERQQRALENRQAAAQAALESEVESNIAAQETIWENRRDKMDEAIEYFQSFTPKNEKELQEHIERTKKKYGKFGIDIDSMFSATSQEIGDLLFTHTRNAALDLKSQVAWESIGERAASRMIAGGLGMTWEQFRKWMGTGKWPEGAGDRAKPPMLSGSSTDDTPRGFGSEDDHEGGLIGTGGSGRKGVARTVKGLHPSETLVRAQKGEFMVKRDQVPKNIDILEAINNGEYNVGGGPGLAGIFGAAMRGAAASTIQNAIAFNHNQMAKKWAKSEKGKKSKGVGPGFVQGAGGRHRPMFGPLTQGLHGSETGYPAIDIGGNLQKVFSVASGKVVSSWDDRGYEPRLELYGEPQNGYKSYGRQIVVDHGGYKTLYAHLNQRFARAGQTVKGGAVIGLSGTTGNSTGPHLHFGAAGISPYAAAGLAKGAANINVEGLYKLHKNEAVLTEDLNRKFKEGVENFASGGNSTYNVNVNVLEPGASADEITRKVVKALEFKESRKPRGR